MGLPLLNRWVNRKDPLGRNIFAGGFLGLDNIGKSLVPTNYLFYNLPFPFTLPSSLPPPFPSLPPPISLPSILTPSLTPSPHPISPSSHLSPLYPHSLRPISPSSYLSSLHPSLTPSLPSSQSQASSTAQSRSPLVASLSRLTVQRGWHSSVW